MQFVFIMMRWNYQLAVVLVMVLKITDSIAQEDTAEIKKKEYVLKYPFSSVLGDIRTNSLGFSIGIESVGKNGWSFSQELGYIFDMTGEKIFSEGNVDDNLDGIRLTSELRKYLFSRNLHPSSGLFLSTEWDNKLTRGSYSIENERKVSDAYRSSLTLNLGMKLFWDPDKAGRLTIDLMIGGGCEYLVADDDSYVYEQGLLFSNDPLYPWLNFDLKLGYILTK